MCIQGKDLVCGWVGSLPVWKVRRPIGMVKSRIEETEEEFNARMAAISSEAKNAEKLQAKPIESLLSSASETLCSKYSSWANSGSHWI